MLLLIEGRGPAICCSPLDPTIDEIAAATTEWKLGSEVSTFVRVSVKDWLFWAVFPRLDPPNWTLL